MDRVTERNRQEIKQVRKCKGGAATCDYYYEYFTKIANMTPTPLLEAKIDL